MCVSLFWPLFYSRVPGVGRRREAYVNWLFTFTNNLNCNDLRSIVYFFCSYIHKYFSSHVWFKSNVVFVLSWNVLTWLSAVLIITDRIKLGHCVYSSHFVLLTFPCPCLMCGCLCRSPSHQIFSNALLFLSLQRKTTHLLLVRHSFFVFVIFIIDKLMGDDICHQQ